jgi:hypothetical protein
MSKGITTAAFGFVMIVAVMLLQPGSLLTPLCQHYCCQKEHGVPAQGTMDRRSLCSFLLRRRPVSNAIQSTTMFLSAGAKVKWQFELDDGWCMVSLKMSVQ